MLTCDSTAKYSQHSADQLPYDMSPLEYFESTFKAKFPEKDIQVCLSFRDVQTTTDEVHSSGDNKLVDSVFLDRIKLRPFDNSRTDCEIESCLLNSLSSTRTSCFSTSRLIIWIWGRSTLSPSMSFRFRSQNRRLMNL